MKRYEVIREIPNQCSNNQMRDVFFEEIECESPLEYVRKMFRGKEIELTVENREDGNTVFVTEGSLTQKYIFTEI